MSYMKKFLLTMLLLFSSLAVAQQSGGFTVKDQQPMYSSSPKIQKAAENSEHCKKLHAKIDELKGKPQRRYAATERYKAECINQAAQ